MPPTRTENKTVKAYADAAEALTVVSDVSGLFVGAATADQQAQQ